MKDINNIFSSNNVGVSRAPCNILCKIVQSIASFFNQFISSITGRESYNSSIVIEGDKDYRERVRQYLDKLKQTETGREIINQLELTGRVVTIKFNGRGQNACRPLSDGAFARRVEQEHGGRLKILEPGAGSESEVYFDPDHVPKYPDGKPCRTPEIGLGHELIHALHNAKGENLHKYRDRSDKDVPGGSNHEEARTIGRGAYQDEKLSDNSLRKERGFRPRNSHASVCP